MMEKEGLGVLERVLRNSGDTDSMVLLLQKATHIRITHKHISPVPCDRSIWRAEIVRTQTARNWEDHVEDDRQRCAGVIPYNILRSLQ